MSGSKKGNTAGRQILLLGWLRSIVTCYCSWIKPEPFGQSWQAVIYTGTTLSQELPCVGDWVCVEKHPADDVGMVHMLLERRTALRRKSAGDSVEYQMIAANMDYVMIVQSCHYDFNLKRLERYLVMVRDGGADPRVLLTKTDLVEPEVLASQLAEIRAAGVTAPVLTLSNVTQEGIDDLKRTLLPSKTYCFVGSSGVGKSTIINQLIGRERLQTKGVSGTGEGRHTTVRRELIILESGALVIDNPGMREFGILGAESGIDGSFSDIIGFASELPLQKLQSYRRAWLRCP